jgi:hypothetical protein
VSLRVAWFLPEINIFHLFKENGRDTRPFSVSLKNRAKILKFLHIFASVSRKKRCCLQKMR